MFFYVQMEVRTYDMCENSDHYRPRQWLGRVDNFKEMWLLPKSLLLLPL